MKFFNNFFKRRNYFKSHLVTFFALLLLLNIFVTKKAFSQSTREFTNGTNTLVVYSNVPGLTPSEFYTIKVRSALTNNEWIDCFANITRSLISTLPPDAPGTSSDVENYYLHLKDWSHTYGNIEMNSRTEVEIAKKNGNAILKATVHPAGRAEAASIIGGKAYFFIDNPALITIDIDGMMEDQNTGDGYTGPAIHAVSLFANPVLNKPVIGASGVYAVEPGSTPPTNSSSYTTLYFKPGVHNIGRNFKVYANKNYYIPGDAMVYGTLNNLGQSSGANIKIYGYGTLSADKIKHPYYDPAYNGSNDEEWKAICINNCSNVVIDGLSVMNGAFHSINIDPITSNKKETFVRWAKVVTWRVNGDGIGSAHDIEDCFIRTQDDCTYVKGDRRRCVMWADVNGSGFMFAGIPTDRAIVIEDCDVLYSRKRLKTLLGGRVFGRRSGQAPNSGMTRVDVLMNNIRVTDKFQTVETFRMVSKDATSSTGGFAGLYFKDITVLAHPAGFTNSIVGHSGGPWDDITFENVVINGEKLLQTSDFGQIGPNVTNVRFLPGGTTQYTISVSVNDINGGTVTGGGTYASGTVVTLTATPNSGYEFSSWSGDLSGSDNPTTITMNSNKNVTANFILSGSPGDVSLIGSWVKGTTHAKVAGSNRALVVMLYGEGSGNISASSVTYGGQTMTKVVERAYLSGAYSYTGAFVLNEAGVAAASSGTIAVTWSTAPSTGSDMTSAFFSNVNRSSLTGATASNGLAGTTITASALTNSDGDMVLEAGTAANNGTYTINNGFTRGIPETSASFGDITSACKPATGANETPSLTMSASMRQTIVGFVLKKGGTVTQYTITASAGSNGTISPSGSVAVDSSANQSFTITPNNGYEVDVVTVDGNPVANPPNPYIFTNVTENHTIYVTFKVKQYTIAASAGSNGSINPSGSVSVNHGANQSFTMVPSDGYEVDVVTVDGNPVANPPNPYTFTNVTANHTISVTFKASATSGDVSLIGSWVKGTTHAKEAGSNRALVVMLYGEGSGNISASSVTYGGQTMTEVEEIAFLSGAYSYTSAFVLNEAGVAAASSGTIAVTWSTAPSTGSDMTSAFFSNVNQSSLTGAFASNGLVGATITTTALANSAGDMVLEAGTAANNGTYTINNGFTRGIPETSASFGDITSAYKAATGANETPSLTMSASMRQTIVGFVLKKASTVTQYTITASAGPNGSISPSGSVLGDSSAIQCFTITPNSGYQIDVFKIDGIIQSVNTCIVADANHTIEVTFKVKLVKQYTITASAGPNGTINPSGSVAVDSSANQSFTITPNSGYQVDVLTVDGNPVASPPNPYTFTNVTANHTISVTFASSPWQTMDIGAVGATGSASYSSPTWTIKGSGADIISTADEFRYVYQSSNGNCSVVARVASIQNTHAWAKAGVMIRQSTAANSPNIFVFVTPTNGVAITWRSTAGGTTNNTTPAVTGQTAPKWLKITRTANVFAAYRSDDGATWTQVGASQTISMTTSATLGLAVTSHADGTLCTSTMDNVMTGLAKPSQELSAEAKAILPTNTQLMQNYPNPFNPETTISYQLSEESHARLTIHNILGEEVARLVDRDQAAGHYSVIWNGRDFSSNTVSSGVYFYVLATNNAVYRMKLILLQ